MRCRRSLVVLSLLLALLGPTARAEDGDLESARQYARSELIKEAARAVKKGRAGAAALEAMRRGLAADVEFASSYEPAEAEDRHRLEAFRLTIAERLLLLGRPPSGEGADADPGTPGAVSESGRLGAWLVGEVPCTIRVRNRDADATTARSYTYPPPPVEGELPGGDPPATRAGAAPDAPAGESLKTPDPKAPDSKPADPKPADPKSTAAGAGDAKGSPPAERKTKDSAEPVAPPDVHKWARDTVRSGEGGSLIDRQLDTLACAGIDALERAAASAPAYIHPDAGDVQRHVFVADEVFAYNKPLAAIRLLQSDEHNKAMQADQPQPSLVDGAMVREKAADAVRYGELIERHAGRTAGIHASLDQMVDHLDAWKTQAALLAGEIEERRRALQPKDGEAADAQVEAGDLILRLAQARETLATLDISLLYQAAVRSRDRVALLKSLMRAAAAEHTAAEHVYIRYSLALEELRNTRRLDRLASDSRAMQRWIAADEASPPAPDSLDAKRLDAYRALLEVNEVVKEAVRRRQLMAPGGAGSGRDEPPEGTSPESEKESPLENGALTESRLSALVLEPQKAGWDLKYVEIAQRELEDPGLHDAFDAELVADHFTAVNGRISALVDAYQIAREEERLRAEFDRVETAAEVALGQLRYDVLTVNVRKLPALLAMAKEDFAAAMDGIAEQRAQNQERLDALVRYRRLLLAQGTRSLLIRVDRSLADSNLGAALRDTRRAIDSAGQWASFQGDRHAGAFLKDAWGRVLLVLLALTVLLFVARLGRRVVDRWIDKRVARYPEMDVSAGSVRAEMERAKERRDSAHAAAAETTADDVLQQGSGTEPPAEASNPGEERTR